MVCDTASIPCGHLTQSIWCVVYMACAHKSIASIDIPCRKHACVAIPMPLFSHRTPFLPEWPFSKLCICEPPKTRPPPTPHLTQRKLLTSCHALYIDFQIRVGTICSIKVSNRLTMQPLPMCFGGLGHACLANSQPLASKGLASIES